MTTSSIPQWRKDWDEHVALISKQAKIGYKFFPAEERMLKANELIRALEDVADAVCKQFAASGIDAKIGSPNPAEDLHARAVIALGGKVEREHIDSGACWCQPEKDYTDPITGVTVWAHRGIQ